MVEQEKTDLKSSTSDKQRTLSGARSNVHKNHSVMFTTGTRQETTGTTSVMAEDLGQKKTLDLQEVSIVE